MEMMPALKERPDVAAPDRAAIAEVLSVSIGIKVWRRENSLMVLRPRRAAFMPLGLWADPHATNIGTTFSGHPSL